MHTVEALAGRGTRLLVAVDCAITAVDEVAAAKQAGIDVVVADHHTRRADGALPDALIVHPALCDYPCAELCATAVAAKLAEALRAEAGDGPGEREHELELVALATVADVVPLRGENRRLVRAGLRALARTARPGLRALLEVAKVPVGSLDEGILAFRLAPRINAAGRLYRPDTALELLLTEDPQRALALARELDRANSERRDIELRIRYAAEAQVAAVGEAAAYVLAGEGWPVGVIGIVAARIAERFHRPAVLIALPQEGTEGTGTGSGRSIPAFDLLGGLTASSEHLEGYGGHRAAAGLQILLQNVDAFRETFVAYAASVLRAEDLITVEHVDAVASGEDVGLELAEELRQLAPFGAGNPGASLLLPAVSLEDPVGFGGEKRSDHVRFTVRSGGVGARAVAFGGGVRLPVEAGVPADASFRLERNEWRDAVEARLVLRQAYPCEPEPITLLGEEGSYLERAFAEFDARIASEPDAALDGGAHGGLPLDCADARIAGSPEASEGRRRLRDRRGRGVAATIAALVASGEPVAVLCANARARSGHLEGRLGGFALCSYAALARDPAMASAYTHVVLLDPPALAGEQAAALAGAAGQMAHLAWGSPELRFASHIHELEYGLRAPLTELYRELRDRGGAVGEEFEAALRGGAPIERSPALAGRMLRVLAEVDLVSLDRERREVSVVAGARVELAGSCAYRLYERQHEEGRRFLKSRAGQPAAGR